MNEDEIREVFVGITRLVLVMGAIMAGLFGNMALLTLCIGLVIVSYILN